MAEPEDFKLIREIVANGGHKYTSDNIDRSRYQRLVNLGWLNAFVTNMSDVAYQVTERGKAAASR
jgi:predicted ABC-type ATPase